MGRIITRLFVPIVLAFVVRIPFAHAADPAVRLVGPAGQVQTGTIFPVEVRLDTGGININAAELMLIVTGEGTEITRLGRESSIFTLWPEAPAINAATARFVGGRPGGVVAVDALIGTVYIVARQAGPVQVTLQTLASGLYRNDGVGTKVTIGEARTEILVADDLLPNLELTSTTHPSETDWNRTGEIDVSWKAQPEEQFSYRLSNDISIIPDDDLDTSINPLRFNGVEDGVWYFVIKRRLPGEMWSPVYQRRFQLDRTAPESFSIEQLSAERVNGQQMIAWSAADATSETVSTLRVGNRTLGVVTSPLLLDPAWAGQTLEVTVADQAGNTRVETWIAPGESSSLLIWWAMWGIVILLVVIVVIMVARRRR